MEDYKYYNDYEDMNLTDYYPCFFLINGTIYQDICCDDINGISSGRQVDSGYDILFNTLNPIITVCGIMGIILTIVVLSRKSMCTSTNCFLMALSSADLGFLTILCTRFLEKTMKGDQVYTFDIYFFYAEIFLNTFVLASVWINVFLALERYIAIVHPLRANMICTVIRARVIIVLIFVISFLCRVPYFFEYTVQTSYMVEGCTEKPVQHRQPTELGTNATYKNISRWIVDCIICAILPFLLLMILNIRLIVEIRKSTNYMRASMGLDRTMQSALTKEQQKITMMLIAMIIVFFMCEAPYVTIIAYINIGHSVHQGLPYVMFTILHVTILLFALKSSLNFILYCWFSEKFWDTLKYKLCLKFCKKENNFERSGTSARFSHHSGNGHVMGSSQIRQQQTKNTSKYPEEMV